LAPLQPDHPKAGDGVMDSTFIDFLGVCLAFICLEAGCVFVLKAIIDFVSPERSRLRELPTNVASFSLGLLAFFGIYTFFV